MPEQVKGQIEVERTLALIKPDIAHSAAEIEDIILHAGFTILQKRRILLSPEQATDFYAEHFGKLFYPSLIAYMSSGPVVALSLARHNAIKHWRELIGPTNPNIARQNAPDSLRAKYGENETMNGFHGSDSPASAEREIRFFFPDAIVEPIVRKQAARDYLARNVNATLLKGLTQICKEKPANPVVALADWLIENNPNKPKIETTPMVIEPSS